MSRTAAGIAATVLASSLPAIAAESSVDVRANIKGTCVIDQVTAVEFGDLQQGTTAPDRTAPGSVRYWCTKGLAYTVAIGTGSNAQGEIRRMKGVATTNSTEYLPYTLTSGSAASAVGVGPATPVTLTLTGAVKGTDYNVLSVGQLKDTVVVTIAP
jgi:spore coat protein U-like protein